MGKKLVTTSFQVKALVGHRIVQVACGSRDAQTLALSDQGLVFSWGDGDFGKLGMQLLIDRYSNSNYKSIIFRNTG